MTSGMLFSFLNTDCFICTMATNKQTKKITVNSFYHKTCKLQTIEVLWILFILHFFFSFSTCLSFGEINLNKLALNYGHYWERVLKSFKYNGKVAKIILSSTNNTLLEGKRCKKTWLKEILFSYQNSCLHSFYWQESCNYR